MEKRSLRRIRDLVAHTVFQGLDANEIGCARISMMAGSKRSLQRAEYRCARPITSDQHSDLQRTAGPTDVPKGDIRIAADFLIRSPRRRGQAVEAAPRGRALEQS